MQFKTLISVEGLKQNLHRPDWVVVDCRFYLDQPDKGRLEYLSSHLPGAVYAHLEEHLSGAVVPGKTGRHPLPTIDDFASLVAGWGINRGTQVVVYDDECGKIAARLWWMLRWMGHETVAVLDGGLPAWIAAGGSLDSELPQTESGEFVPQPRGTMVATAEEILRCFGDPAHLLVDSRSPERYCGDEEPIDPVAGHIPGAKNYFWQSNISSRGTFEIKDVLRGRFTALFKHVPPGNVVFYCGSGVTAAVNVLAVTHAGFAMPKLYPGSWSEWITDPQRPIATGCI